MIEKIKSKLKLIEKDNNIEILYACESGSRVWGFSNENSDYDIRFIYKKSNLKDYLTLQKTKDVIEYNDGILDIVGWDIKKALMLHYKNNPNLRELILSNQVYFGNSDIFNNLGDFNKAVLKYHYESIALNHLKKYCNNGFDKTRLKKYLYIIRCILVLQLLNKNIYPPINIHELLNHRSIILKDDIKKSIEKLIYIHTNLKIDEIDSQTINTLVTFINNNLSSFKKDKTKIIQDKNIEDYNNRFQDIILDYD